MHIQILARLKAEWKEMAEGGKADMTDPLQSMQGTAGPKGARNDLEES